MIRLAKSSDKAELLCAAGLYRPAGAAIATAWALYSTSPGQALFWLSDDGGAAISLVDGEMNISAGNVCDTDELCDFARAVGFKTLSAPPEICGQLSDMGRVESGAVMEYRGGIAREFTTTEADPQDVYSLICNVTGQKLQSPAWSPWYVHLSLLKRRGIGRFVGIYENEKLISTAGIYAQDKTHALIAGAATAHNHRGRGLAGELVAALAAEATASGKIPFLLCDDKLCGWYEGLGFTAMGRWNKIYVGEKIL